MNADDLTLNSTRMRTYPVGGKRGSWGPKGTLTITPWDAAFTVAGVFRSRQIAHVYRDTIDGTVESWRQLLGGGVLRFAADGWWFEFATGRHDQAAAARALLCSRVR